MSKTTKIILAVVAVAVVALVGVILMMNSKPASNLSVNSAEDLTALVDQIYEGVSIEMPMLMTQELDMTDAETVKYFTGLENINDIEYVVASEPMMTSQAYSLMLVKVKDGVDADAIAKSMNENVDERKWICVTAEKIYSVASGDVVCLVMSNEQTAKTVYDSFKTLAGSVGQEFERSAEEPEMPEDMLPGMDMLPAEDGDMPAAM
ncbi:MAG: hypothetical protein IJE68_03770 [Clostridia bacterium]|nr:hypothetical protein [Clostridia bacterium]